MQHTVRFAQIPDRPDVIKIVISYSKLMLVNKSASADAKIIWLLQSPDDLFPAPVTFA